MTCRHRNALVDCDALGALAVRFEYGEIAHWDDDDGLRGVRGRATVWCPDCGAHFDREITRLPKWMRDKIKGMF